MAKRNLDFIMIGAAKSGTTSLFHILNESDEIFLPAEKELPFFSKTEMYEKGVDYLINKAYKNAPKGAILGKITPQYMGGQTTNMPETIATRIHESCPEVKIIAILRDPAKRAFSHYSMAVRLGHEKRDFDTTVDELLKKKSLAAARKEHSWTNTYVVGGEYGRILTPYFDLFPKKDILVLFTSELNEDPDGTLKKISKFIGAKESFVFSKAEERSNVGSEKPKTKILTPGFLYRLPGVKFIWTRVVPYTLRHRMNQLVANWNIKPDSEKRHASPEAEAKLREHYEQDKKVLEKLIGRKVDW